VRWRAWRRLLGVPPSSFCAPAPDVFRSSAGQLGVSAVVKARRPAVARQGGSGRQAMGHQAGSAASPPASLAASAATACM